jgi:hypothetical protein
MPSTENLSGNIALPQLSVSTDGGTVYAPIAELTADPALGGITTDSYETTHTDITDNFKTFLEGWSDAAEHSFTVNYREDTYSQLRALIGQGTLDWKITWTDPGDTVTDPELDFQGHISAGPTLVTPLQDKWTIDFSVKLTGADTFTEGTDA